TRIIKFIDYNFVIGADGTQVLGVQNGYFTKFMYYQLLKKEIPSTGYNRHFKFLKEMKFFRPSYEEQIAIATVLSDMDSEIEELESQLQKYRKIKLGIMQVLLTGKIRLLTS
ncbi:hypothetical protein L0244_34475, partial [bacterium]|nr:hypothetical protein [bacterium]